MTHSEGEKHKEGEHRVHTGQVVGDECQPDLLPRTPSRRDKDIETCTAHSMIEGLLMFHEI